MMMDSPRSHDLHGGRHDEKQQSDVRPPPARLHADHEACLNTQQCACF